MVNSLIKKTNAQETFNEILVDLAKQYESEKFSKSSIQGLFIRLPENDLLVEPKVEFKRDEERNWYRKSQLFIEADLTGSLNLEGFTNLGVIEICGQSLTDLKIEGYRHFNKLKLSSNRDLKSLKIVDESDKKIGTIESLILTNCPQVSELNIDYFLGHESYGFSEIFQIENFGNVNTILELSRFIQKGLEKIAENLASYDEYKWKQKNSIRNYLNKFISFFDNALVILKEKQDRIVNLQTQLNLLQKEKENYDSEKNNLEEEKNTFIQRIEQLKDNIANLKHDIQENDKKFKGGREQLTTDYNQQIKDKENTISDLTNKIKDKESQITDLEKRAEEKETEINTLQSEINQQQEQLGLKDKLVQVKELEESRENLITEEWQALIKKISQVENFQNEIVKIKLEELETRKQNCLNRIIDLQKNKRFSKKYFELLTELDQIEKLTQKQDQYVAQQETITYCY